MRKRLRYSKAGYMSHSAETIVKYVLVVIAVLLFIVCDKTTAPTPVHYPIAGNGLTVLAPKGDSTYYVGDWMEISWEIKDSSIFSGLIIDFSPTKGKDYCLIGSFYTTTSYFQDKKFYWLIPDSVFTCSKKSTVSDSCKIWIHDYWDYAIGDVSDKLFSIHKR